VTDGRLDLGNVLVNHVDPSRAARSGHERKSTSLLLLEHLHTLIKLSSLGQGGHISTDSNLDADVETGLNNSLLEGSNADGVREVTSNSRSEHSNHLTVGIDDTTDNISDLSAGLNSTEWAVADTLTTADALVIVEDLTIVRKSLDGSNRAVRNARSDLTDDGTEWASLGAVTATDTLCRVDTSLSGLVVDSLLGAALSARTGSAVLAHVSHDVLILGAAVAKVVHESDDGKSKVTGLALHSLLGILREGLTIILLNSVTKSGDDTATNLVTKSRIFLRNKLLRKIVDLLNELVCEEETADAFHDIVLNLDDAIGNGRSREIHLSSRRSRNTRVSRSSSHYESIKMKQ